MGIACLLIVAALLLTTAPNGWLGWLASVIVLLVYIIKRGGKKSRWLMVGVGLLGLVLIVALIGLLAGSDTGRDFISTERQSRAILWRPAWEIARGNVLLGVGPGMFRWLYPAQRTLQGVVDSTQNEYLNVLTEYGILGLALALWALAAFVMSATQILSVRASRYSASTLSNRYAFTIGGLGAVAALAVGSVFDSSLHAPANLFTVVAIMAATLTCGVHPERQDGGSRRVAGALYAPFTEGAEQAGAGGHIGLRHSAAGLTVEQELSSGCLSAVGGTRSKPLRLAGSGRTLFTGVEFRSP